MTAPEWQRRSGSAWAIVELQRGDEVLEFVPPNIIFVSGGEGVRVLDHDGDAPVLQVQRIQRDAAGVNVVHDYPMRVRP